MVGKIKFMDLIFRSRKIYDNDHLIPKTTIYKCRSCGKEHEFIKYDNFTNVIITRNFYQNLSIYHIIILGNFINIKSLIGIIVLNLILINCYLEYFNNRKY